MSSHGNLLTYFFLFWVLPATQFKEIWSNVIYKEEYHEDPPYVPVLCFNSWDFSSYAVETFGRKVVMEQQTSASINYA